MVFIKVLIDCEWETIWVKIYGHWMNFCNNANNKLFTIELIKGLSKCGIEKWTQPICVKNISSLQQLTINLQFDHACTLWSCSKQNIQSHKKEPEIHW